MVLRIINVKTLDRSFFLLKTFNSIETNVVNVRVLILKYYDKFIIILYKKAPIKLQKGFACVTLLLWPVITS